MGKEKYDILFPSLCSYNLCIYESFLIIIYKCLINPKKIILYFISTKYYFDQFIKLYSLPWIIIPTLETSKSKNATMKSIKILASPNKVIKLTWSIKKNRIRSFKSPNLKFPKILN